jgi:hypothetical protein
MVSSGATGHFAVGQVASDALALTSDILKEVVARFVNTYEPPLKPPRELHHFTSLGTAHQIIETDNIRLSHAEYSNDQTELAEAKDIIRAELGSRSPTPFFNQVLSDYTRLAPSLDAYIFCMCTGTNGSLPQDILSQWRAYGQDGRGACLTMDTRKLTRLVSNTPALRINPVIYERTKQLQFIDDILTLGLAADARNDANAREATVAALVFATLLMKASGFAEEREWRLVFMPPVDVKPVLGFYPRRDFLAPYINLKHLWDDLRPKMIEVATLRATLPTMLPSVKRPLVPLTKVMVGPSGHQLLNERAMSKLLAQTARATVPVLKSSIPYRSLT